MNPVQEAKSPGDGCLEGVRGGALVAGLTCDYLDKGRR